MFEDISRTEGPLREHFLLLRVSPILHSSGS